MGAGGINNRIATGTYTGTGSAISVTLGFKPKYIRIINITDGDVRAEYIDTMTAAHVALEVDSGSGTTDLSNATSNGITLSSSGFSVGTNSSLNESDKVYHYVAI